MKKKNADGKKLIGRDFRQKTGQSIGKTPEKAGGKDGASAVAQW